MSAKPQEAPDAEIHTDWMFERLKYLWDMITAIVEKHSGSMTGWPTKEMDEINREAKSIMKWIIENGLWDGFKKWLASKKSADAGVERDTVVYMVPRKLGGSELG